MKTESGEHSIKNSAVQYPDAAYPQLFQDIKTESMNSAEETSNNIRRVIIMDEDDGENVMETIKKEEPQDTETKPIVFSPELHFQREKPRKKHYSCLNCDKTFAKRNRFLQHLHMHTGLKPYSCLQCGKKFAVQSHLKYHQRVHTGERPYSCLECGKSFTQLSSFKYHQRMHTGERPYSCTQCGKRFIQHKSLKYHKRIHTGEKPYSCPQCGKCFARQDSLKCHQRVHTGEKPYSCTQCGRSFTQQNGLNNHQRIHTGEKPYLCTECGKSFTHQNGLKYHQRIHIETRPNQCTECGRSFASSDRLQRHLRVHTREKSYTCRQCGKVFPVLRNLKIHQLDHKGEECDSTTLSVAKSDGINQENSAADSEHSGERSTVVSAKKRKVDSENRQFNSFWTDDYCFVLPSLAGAKPTCLLCSQTVAVCKVVNIRRHFQSRHKNFDDEFPVKSESRRQRIANLIASLEYSITISYKNTSAKKNTTTTTDLSKRKVDKENRQFRSVWTDSFLFILPHQTGAKPTCLLCFQTVAVCKVDNIRRHFQSCHRGFDEEFPATSESRKQKIEHLIALYNQVVTSIQTENRQNSASIASKRKVDKENRQFNCFWTDEYCFILPNHTNAKPTCLLCTQTVAVCKVTNIRRHFQSCHRGFDDDYPLPSESRKQVINNLIAAYNQCFESVSNVSETLDNSSFFSPDHVQMGEV